MRRYTPVLSVVMVLVFASAALACPMCKDSIAETGAAAQQQYGSGGPEASLPSGFNFSIYYMLAGLFCMLGLVLGVIAKGVRDSNSAMSPAVARGAVKSPN